MEIKDTSSYITKVLNVLENNLTKGKIRSLEETPRYANCFVYVIKGQTKYTFSNGKTVITKDESILFLRKNEQYYMEVLSNTYSFIFFDFELDNNSELTSDLFKDINPNLSELFRLLLTSFYSVSKSKNAMIMKISNEILYEIIETQNKNSIQNNSPIDRLIRDINNNFSSSKYNVHKLSKNTNISETQIRRIFSKYKNMGPNEYINNLRFEKAQILLKIKENNISEIAYMCGFSNVQYFSSLFKKRYGKSPKRVLNINSNV